jgi:hypothetical protein
MLRIGQVVGNLATRCALRYGLRAFASFAQRTSPVVANNTSATTATAVSVRTLSDATTFGFGGRVMGQPAPTLRVATKFGAARMLSTSAVDTNIVDESMDAKPTVGDFLVAISELKRLYGIDIETLRKLILTGNQSSGKTGLLEAICGFSIFPKDSRLATKKPFHITGVRTDGGSLYKINGETIYTDLQASRLLNSLNNDPTIESVEIEIHGPEVYDFRITDLPGLTENGDNEHFLEMVQRVNDEYINDPNNFLLVVSSMTEDPNNGKALSKVRKAKATGRSMGFFTKADLIQDGDDISERLEMIDGTHPYLNLEGGWMTCFMRDDKSTKAGVSVKQQIEIEKKFFANPKNSRLIQGGPDKVGIPAIRRAINGMLVEDIKDKVPLMRAEIHEIREQLARSAEFLEGAKNSDEILRSLHEMMRKLYDGSIERIDYEETFREKMADAVTGPIVEIMGSDVLIPKFSKKEIIDRGLLSFLSSRASDPTKYENDEFQEKFRYGAANSIFTSVEAIKNAQIQEVNLGASMGMVEFYKDDPRGRKSLKWAGYLKKFGEALLKDGYMRKIVFDTTVTSLTDYVGNGEGNALQNIFVEHIVKELAEKAFDEKIQFAIDSLITRQKRPKVVSYELVRQITKMYPKHFKFEGTLFESRLRENKALEIEVYGEEFNRAYVLSIAEIIADDITRSVHESFTEILSLELLRKSAKLLNKDGLKQQQQEIENKHRRLDHLDKILVHFEEK